MNQSKFKAVKWIFIMNSTTVESDEFMNDRIYMNPLLSNKQKLYMEVNKVDGAAHNTARQVEVMRVFMVSRLLSLCDLVT